MATKATAKVKAAIGELVAANRILARQHVVDAYGHVSLRHPADPKRFLLSRSRAPELVVASDIMEFDLDSNALHGDKRAPYLERFIHGRIYATRPDVMAVVHSHAASVIPFASSSVKLQPLYHMGGFLGQGAPVFDIRKGFGATDMLVRNNAQGDALAASLSRGAIALMRGHGYVTVGPTLPIAVYRAIYTQTNAALQQNAITLGGDVTYLNPEEAAQAMVNVEATIERPWELWKRNARSRR